VYYSFTKIPTDYNHILNLQQKIRDDVIAEKYEEGVILFLTHNPCFTIGLRGKESEILVDKSFLEKEGIEVF